MTSRLVEKDSGLKKQQKKPGMTATHLPICHTIIAYYSLKDQSDQERGSCGFFCGFCQVTVLNHQKKETPGTCVN